MSNYIKPECKNCFYWVGDVPRERMTESYAPRHGCSYCPSPRLGLYCVTDETYRPVINGHCQGDCQGACRKEATHE
jgi:hypothetical protein